MLGLKKILHALAKDRLLLNINVFRLYVSHKYTSEKSRRYLCTQEENVLGGVHDPGWWRALLSLEPVEMVSPF